MHLNVSGAGSLKVEPNIFGVDYNKPLIHQAVVAFLASARMGSVKQKNRAEVAGGNKKPWKQKGSGRARAGSSTGPIWRGGGVSFAARPQSYVQKLNKKMYRLAIKSILSELVRQERLIVIEDFSVPEPKTKLVVQKLRTFNLEKEKVLIISQSIDNNSYLAVRNIPNLAFCDVSNSDPVVLVGSSKVLVTVDAVKAFEELLK